MCNLPSEANGSRVHLLMAPGVSYDFVSQPAYSKLSQVECQHLYSVLYRETRIELNFHNTIQTRTEKPRPFSALWKGNSLLPCICLKLYMNSTRCTCGRCVYVWIRHPQVHYTHIRTMHSVHAMQIQMVRGQSWHYALACCWSHASGMFAHRYCNMCTRLKMYLK